MAEKKMSLSDKIKCPKHNPWLDPEDVKESIKKVLKKLCPYSTLGCEGCLVCDTIKKEIGRKLT